MYQGNNEKSQLLCQIALKQKLEKIRNLKYARSDVTGTFKQQFATNDLVNLLFKINSLANLNKKKNT